MKEKACAIPRWQALANQLNNLEPKAFITAIQASNNPIIIDVRTPEEFATDALPNAINVDYFGADLIEELEALDASRDCFVYCRSGRRSVRVCTLMRNGGFNNNRLFNLNGGMKAMNETSPKLSEV